MASPRGILIDHASKFAGARSVLGLLIFILAGFTLPPSTAALEYLDNRGLQTALEEIAQNASRLVHLKSVAESRNKEKIWLVEIGSGPEADRKTRPALLVVAGIEGNDLAGSMSAVAWIRHLAAEYQTNTAIKQLLDTSTVYLFPRVNPDAASHFFKKPKWETATNDRPVDEDHDGLADEDGSEDLNGDGLITSMRVQDPEGEHILDPSDSRLLIKADKIKGETANWLLLTEGSDNDQDENWNEDGPGGVNFNRNFPYNYSFFAPWAGRHQVSEPETRALADFVVNHPNIAVTFTFGAADNLSQTPKGEAPKRPPAGIHEEDVPLFRELGKQFRDTLELKKELPIAAQPGSFSDWIYFHRGRLSLAARPWSPALALELFKPEKPSQEKMETKEEKKAEPAEPENNGKKQKKPEEDKRNEEERSYLKWLEENAPEQFISWNDVAHPDFPNRKVEIGGFAPFAKTNPPEKFLEKLSQRHGDFLTILLGKLPRIGIRKTEARHLDESVYDVRIVVENTGYLPAVTAQGILTREINPTRVKVDLPPESFLSGAQTTLVDQLAGSGGSREIHYILLAKERKKIEVEVSSTLGGTTTASIELKQE